jgi:predicted acetyltransferase
MTGEKVRTIGAAEIDAWARQRSVGFLGHVAEGTGEFLLGIVDLDRTWAAFDDGAIVGTLRSFATELTVPGPAGVPAAALTNVTVAPTHRRRGLLSRMIAEDLRRSAERGEAVGILIASEYPIYGRFGYGPAVEGATWSVGTAGLRFLSVTEGSVELVELAELRELGPGVYERVRAAQPGAIGRDDGWWDRWLHQVAVPGEEPAKGYQVLYRSPAGEPEGYARYETKQEWEGMSPQGTLQLGELTAATPAAYRALWAYCAGVDLLTTIEASTRPVDEVLPLLVHDGRRVRQTHRYDFVWVRVLDAAAALSGRSYGCEGRLVLEVVDPDGFAGGRFVLEGGRGGATCTPTAETAQLTLPVHALGSIYLGGFAPSRLQAAGQLEEHAAGAAALADAMFCTARAPWCATWF